ncbi:uncharacterized protein CELE_K11H3.5 [Caenorhabditis elegans]|uniref:Uncharacterized protein K11H3.5 n=1 Tax=Caenorhabditis elegans TaxID=6239 RepID=YM45_CAEEL|nr:Uncharacterized protein CELE_K11H3.5 [Caenorhabditis elegans]P34521.2 RecName: Full=Uncharacterized protein K11H3.5; Flags: Precursor [Caenorhabditis elegans]CAA80177.2 Uncharacterized protein CELE_K11H3.5 [Caenorhabditis elegans]|eukprot:NP_001255037.1 Uncharacterized protein CELE_K11H3.5 [Caenorhabditis elegans]
MRTLMLIILSILIYLSSAKPVFGPIGVVEKHKIAKMLQNEQKSLQMLEEEQALLEKVVETLSNDIEEKEEKIEKLRRSYTNGNGALANIYEDYRSGFKSGIGARPGR